MTPSGVEHDLARGVWTYGPIGAPQPMTPSGVEHARNSPARSPNRWAPQPMTPSGVEHTRVPALFWSVSERHSQ